MQMRSASAEAHRLADEKSVVQDVVVSERGALRKAGRAAGELDVDRIVELQLAAALGDLGAVARASPIPATSANVSMPGTAPSPITMRVLRLGSFAA